jgi:hypothetical protein
MLFFLNSLERTTTDSQAEQAIQETTAFVKQKTKTGS